MSSFLRTYRIHVVASLTGFGLLAARGLSTGRGDYLFFVWNLFLAWLPLWFATWAVRAAAEERNGMAWMAGGLWLLFFPNAPYLVTDLKHWTARPPVPAWYDLWLAVHFAWVGMSLGFASLQLMEGVVTRRRGARVGAGFTAVALGLASFGIYLGRYGRWNSWDLVTRPGALLEDIAGRIINPWDHSRTWVYTAVGAVFLWCAYAMQRVQAERLLQAVPAGAELSAPPK